MDFALSDEQQAIRELARKILETEVSPARLKEVEAGEEWFDRSVWGKLARSQLLGVAIPEEYGGQGLGLFELCLLLEEIGRTVAPVPTHPALVAGALPVARFGTAEQRRRLLRPVAAGETILSAALYEGGSEDPARPITRARREGSDWILEGRKSCVPAAHLASAVLTPARTEEGEAALFLVDPRANGVRLERQTTTRGEPEFRMDLAGVRVPEGDLLGARRNGTELVRWLVDRAVVGLCATQVGVSERALRITADYTSGRIQFGQPIGSFQAVHQRAADAYIDVEAMRLTTWQAAWLLSEERPAGAEVAVAKFWAAEGGHAVAYAAQHLHGGLGYDVDYLLHRYTLWSKQIELSLGSATHQLVRLGAWLVDAPEMGEGAAGT